MEATLTRRAGMAGRNGQRHEGRVCPVWKTLTEDRTLREFDVQLADTATLLERRAEARAQSVGLGTQGGYLAPEGFADSVEQALFAADTIRSLATVIRTDGRGPFKFPTVNDVTNKGRLLPENSASTTTDAGFGQLVFHAYKYTSDRLDVPAELAEDAGAAFASMLRLGELAGARIARGQNAGFVTGTGASQPTGVVTACVQSGAIVSAGSPTAISSDDLMNLADGPDISYRFSPTSGFMMHPAVFKLVRKLKDGVGGLLFKPGRPDQPLALAGHYLFLNNEMSSSVASGTVSVLFGDFSRYCIRDAGKMRVRSYSEASGLAEKDVIAFSCELRSDGNILDAGTKPIWALRN